MTYITYIDESNPNKVQHIELLGNGGTEGMDTESVDLETEQIERNIEDSENIMSYLAGSF